MSVYPIVLQGEAVRALVVGGGAVAERKVKALLDGGSHVRLLSPTLTAQLRMLLDERRIEWTAGEYSAETIGDANLIFAATDSASTNAMIAGDARARNCFVNVVDDALGGDFATPATHRDGPIVIAVFASGVPAAAARLRTHLANAIGAGVSAAVTQLVALRGRMLAAGKAEEWKSASADLIGEDFPDSVGGGDFERRIQRWR